MAGSILNINPEASFGENVVNVYRRVVYGTPAQQSNRIKDREDMEVIAEEKYGLDSDRYGVAMKEIGELFEGESASIGPSLLGDLNNSVFQPELAPYTPAENKFVGEIRLRKTEAMIMAAMSLVSFFNIDRIRDSIVSMVIEHNLLANAPDFIYSTYPGILAVAVPLSLAYLSNRRLKKMKQIALTNQNQIRELKNALLT